MTRDPIDPAVAGIAKKLRAVVVMGGWYLRPDGAVKRPSYNTLMDLPAARRVLQRDGGAEAVAVRRIARHRRDHIIHQDRL